MFFGKSTLRTEAIVGQKKERKKEKARFLDGSPTQASQFLITILKVASLSYQSQVDPAFLKKVSASMIQIVLDPTHGDSARWKWQENGVYSAASTYKMLTEGGITVAYDKAIWKCWAPLSCKI